MSQFVYVKYAFYRIMNDNICSYATTYTSSSGNSIQANESINATTLFVGQLLFARFFMIRTRPLNGWCWELSLHCLRYAFTFYIFYISCKQLSRISVSLHSMETAINAYYEVNKRPLVNFNWNPWYFSQEMLRNLHSKLHWERANELKLTCTTKRDQPMV